MLSLWWYVWEYVLETVRYCSKHALDSQEATLLSWSVAIVVSQGRALWGPGTLPAVPVSGISHLHFSCLLLTY